MKKIPGTKAPDLKAAKLFHVARPFLDVFYLGIINYISIYIYTHIMRIHIFMHTHVYDIFIDKLGIYWGYTCLPSFGHIWTTCTSVSGVSHSGDRRGLLIFFSAHIVPSTLVHGRVWKSRCSAPCVVSHAGFIENVPHASSLSFEGNATGSRQLL